MGDSSSGLFIGILVIYFCYLICPSFSYLLWSLISSAGILVLISCWNSCVYWDYILYWGLTYSWVCFHLAYVRRHNVSVSLGSGRYTCSCSIYLDDNELVYLYFCTHICLAKQMKKKTTEDMTHSWRLRRTRACRLSKYFCIFFSRILKFC